MRVVVYDTTETRPPFLSTWWGLGAAISGADVVIRAGSWGEAYSELRKVDGRIHQLQVWGHGNDGAPYIAGLTVSLTQLRNATPGGIGAVWWRACEVHRGPKGKAFALDVTRTLAADSVGHCVVISAPNPLVQGAICALRPGEHPWWDDYGKGLRGCSTLRMTPPGWAYVAA